MSGEEEHCAYMDNQKPNSATFLDTVSGYNGWTIVIVSSFVYLMYYLFYMVKKPNLVGNSRLVDFVKLHCPSLTEPYWPTFWCVEARAQTILGTVFKRAAKIRYSREYLELDDGGCIGLDWVYNNENSTYTAQSRPTVIILPGIIGNSEANYARNFTKVIAKLGYRSCVFNYRGNGGVELKTARTYCASKTDDFEVVIDHIKNRFPEAPLMATGISMGGLKLVNYLATAGSDTPLIAGMVISVPYEVFESCRTLEQPLNSFLFNRMLTKLLVDRVKSYEDLFRGTGHIDVDTTLQSRTIRQFDENFTCKVFGYSSWDEYYRDANIHHKLHRVKVPVLALNAADDPFSPGNAIPLKEASESSSVMIAVTPYGGHIGFLDGIFPRYQTFMDRVYKEFVDAIFRNKNPLDDNDEDDSRAQYERRPSTDLDDMLYS